MGSASSLSNTVRPRVVVVARIPGDTFDSEVLHFRSQLASHLKFSDVFSSLNVINIIGKSRPSALECSALKEVLVQEIEASRLARTNSSALFSLIHSASFFEKALVRFSKSPEASFDFVRASRDGNSVSPEFQDHIGRFMSLCLEHRVPDSSPLPHRIGHPAR